MNELDKVIEELNKLPKGYISRKHINGNTYFYLQQRKAKLIESKYIKPENLDEIRDALYKRDKLETILKNLVNEGEDIKELTSRDEELTGFVMMGNQIVAKVNHDVIEWKSNHAPLIFSRSNYLSSFLKKRVIDEDRANSRLLKKALNMKITDPAKIPLYVYGAVITDNYWFRPSGSRAIYEDIKFKNDTYSDLSLYGDYRFVPKKAKKSPQLTLVGSYEKCWKLIDGEWWLYKAQNEKEIFSEIFCSRFAEILGIPTAFYERDDKFIRTKNFADSLNFEPISSLAGDDDSYENVFNVCLKLSEDIAKDYLKLMYFDALVQNVDRHNENLGVMRNKRSGRIICLAPNFDNNVALISRGEVLNEDRMHYGMCPLFIKFIKSNPDALRLSNNLNLPDINASSLDYCFDFDHEPVNKNNIVNFILNGAQYIKDSLKY